MSLGLALQPCEVTADRSRVPPGCQLPPAQRGSSGETRGVNPISCSLWGLPGVWAGDKGETDSIPPPAQGPSARPFSVFSIKADKTEEEHLRLHFSPHFSSPGIILNKHFIFHLLSFISNVTVPDLSLLFESQTVPKAQYISGDELQLCSLPLCQRLSNGEIPCVVSSLSRAPVPGQGRIPLPVHPGVGKVCRALHSPLSCLGKGSGLSVLSQGCWSSPCS